MQGNHMMPLDRNESYWMLDGTLVEAARNGDSAELSTYPDYGKLRSSLAAYAGVIFENILVTPGSDAAIEHVVRVYAANGGEVVLPVPTFYGYESILERAGAKIVPIAYTERAGRFVFPLTKTVEALERGTAKILFLCHPNNPLGCPLLPKDISAIVAAARKSRTLIVSDEAYFEFSKGTSFLPYLGELSNLVVIRTMSKAFSLSGARVGYAIAGPDIISKLGKRMLPWPIAHQSVVAALALLGRAGKVAACRKLVIETRERVYNALCANGFDAYPSETNFILVRVPDATHVRDAFLKQGIRVALGEPMSRFEEAKTILKNTVRIAVPAPESETFFIDAFRKAVR